MSICHVISKDNMFKGLPDFIGKTPITHYLTKFNDQRSCGSRNMTYSICHVTFQDHKIKRFGNFIQRSSAVYRTTQPSLVVIVFVEVET